MPISTTRTRTIPVPYGLPNKYSLWIKDESGVYSPTEYNFTNKLFTFSTPKRLNKIWTLTARIANVSANNRNYIKRGNTVKFFVNNTVWLIGHIKAAPISNNIADIEVMGRVAWTLGNDHMDRVEYTDTAFNTVNANIVSGTSVSMDTNENYGNVTIRFDGDDKMAAIELNVESVNYDWHESWGDSPYDSLFMNAEAQKGSASDVYTFTRTGEGANIIESKVKADDTKLVNYVTVLGFGDGDLQLQSICFHATTVRTTLASALTATGTTVSLTDASGFPSSGDVWIGCEKISYSGKDGNDLTGCTRAVSYMGNVNNLPSWKDDTSGYAHDAGISVYDAQYTADVSGSQTGSSIKDNGVVKGRAINRAIINQNSLDRIAQNIIDDFKTPPEFNTLRPKNPKTVIESVTVGDYVSATDSLSGLSGSYRVKGMILSREESGEEKLILELSNVEQDFVEIVNTINKNLDKEASKLQGAPNYIPLHLFENADDAKHGIIRMFVPSELVAIKKSELKFILTGFRAYNDASQTSAGGSSHGHGLSGVTSDSGGQHDHNLAEETADWPTSGFPRSEAVGATTTTDVTHTHDFTGQTTEAETSHTHNITMTFGIYEESLSNPSVDIYMGEFGGSMSKVNSAAFTSADTLLTQDITATLRALGTNKLIEIQFRCNKNMRIECSGYILGHLKP